MRWRLFALSVASVLGAWHPVEAARAEIREGHFYVDGEPFYVRAVGYQPWRPHQTPGTSYVSTNRKWTQRDFERIKAAHFNTIRTWEPLAPEELALARDNGLWVLQGVRIDTHQDFSNPHNQDIAVSEVETAVENSKDYDNVLGYVLMAEPTARVILESGIPESLQFFRRLKRTVQALDPRPVTIDSGISLAFMDHHDFDFVLMNAYAFWPSSLTQALGFPEYVRWLVDHVGADRPVIIGETGGYSVSLATRTASGGCGGFTEYEQSIHDIESLRGTVQGHAEGSVLRSWIDTWFYPRDPDTHDNEPWEWDGLLAIPTDTPKDMVGIPRQIVGDVTKHNEALIIEPKADHIYPQEVPVPILVVTADNVQDVRYNLNGDDWVSLTGSGNGRWTGFFKLPKTARRRQRLSIESLGEDGSVLNQQSVSFVTAETPEHLFLAPAPSGNTHELSFIVTLTDDTRHPIVNRKVTYGFFYPVTQREDQGHGLTDTQGHLTIRCSVPPETPDRYIYVAAGTESPDRLRAGDMRIFTLGQ